ncbi:4-hydroxy-3-methylbut-2-enyl diphosphate reductase, partial [bacterium]|nr:4-hydroxy-3-methylbut-2-enyl diphosphate reductase [bacterium]
MRVKLAKTAGFCMGVKRAVEFVLKTAGEYPGPIFTWGPLIHNPQTVDFLKEQGVDVIDTPSEIPKDSTVVIRSHGISPEERRAIVDSGASICDATCPKVARVQGLIKRAANQGRDIIIVGNKKHAEVRGLSGYAGERGHIVGAKEDIENLEGIEAPAVFAQTTLINRQYFELASAIEEKFPGAEIFDTLCDSTSERQNEIAELSKEADAIVVVGGFNSGNTKQLFEVAKSTGIVSFWVETADELKPDDFRGMETVAVTAGASTPHWVVSRVIERLERFNERHLPPWRWPWLKAAGYIAIQSNILTGLAAAMLAASAIFIAGGTMKITTLLAIGLFVMSMHTLYNLVDWQSLALVDPSKIRFFWGNRRLLSLLSAFGLLLALPLSMLSGLYPFLLMCAGAVLATVFVSLKRMPNFLKKRGFGTWRSIPGAKDLLHIFGWILAT